MTSYVFALIYIVLGLIGASGHYLKKRYWDNTTKESFLNYLSGEPKATMHAVVAVTGSSIMLSLAHTGTDWLTLSELIGAITAGYANDSAFNRAADSAGSKP